MNSQSARDKWALVIYEMDSREREAKQSRIRQGLQALVACILLLALWEGFIALMFWAGSR